MKCDILTCIENYGAEIVIFDIDGTLKDIVGEHSEALLETLNTIERKNFRKNIVLLLDRIAMWFIKNGILPTTEKMQHKLTTLYSLVLNEYNDKFKEKYKFFYKRTVIPFISSNALLEELLKTKKIYFVTINKQKYNLETKLLSKGKVIYAGDKSKVYAYQRLFKEENIDKEKAIIIGDNILDDINAAKILGVRCLLVDNYNSKIKRFISKVLNVGICK